MISITRVLGVMILALGMVPFVFAGDVTFTKSGVYMPKLPNEIKVNLVLSDTKLTIASQDPNGKSKKEQGEPIRLEIPYSGIDKMSYEVGGHHRTEDVAFGWMWAFTKETSRYLDIDYRDGDATKVIVLRLDKSEYEDVLAKLEAMTGKKIDTVEEKTSKLNPTAESKDMDELVPFGLDAIRTALTPAMESMGCHVSKSEPQKIECKRPGASSGRDRDRTGIGGEKVVATIKEEKGETRVRINTEKGFAGRLAKKNWSTPIFNEMMKTLQTPAQTPK